MPLIHDELLAQYGPGLVDATNHAVTAQAALVALVGEDWP
jgi:hypothetical protein